MNSHILRNQGCKHATCRVQIPFFGIFSSNRIQDRTMATDSPKTVKEKSNQRMPNENDVSKKNKGMQHLLQNAKDALFVQSVTLPSSTPVVRGYDWNQGLDYSKLLKSFEHCGQQATNFGLAVKEVNNMIRHRNDVFEPDCSESEEDDEFVRLKSNLTIFFGYTSNMVTSGTRETIRFLVQHKMVDCIVTTAGGVEEDFIKCLAPTYVGRFHVDDRQLREEGINRAGNLYIPNENYCLFENWVMPVLSKMVEEQKSQKILWTPSKVITRLGQEINHEDSIYYWAAVNKIPVFCPALTDGSLGDMIFFQSFQSSGLVLDIAQDVRRMNTIAIRAKRTGMVILGGGIVKHHICNANLMRNGADFSVYINTGMDYDGSDGGARPEEAISWGKIKREASPVKVWADATLVFPLLVAETFAKHHFFKKDDHF